MNHMSQSPMCLTSRLASVCWPILAATMSMLLAIECLSTSPVWHEPAQLLAGLNSWRFRRFDTIQVNPPLVRLLATLPVVRSSVLNETKFNQPTHHRNEFAMASDFLMDNEADAIRLIRKSRWICVVFASVGAYVSWRFSYALYGVFSGCVATALWCFSPTILGHASTLMCDAHAATMGLATVYCFWQWLRLPRIGRAIGTGVVLALAELCKFTLLVFYPLLPLVWVVYRLSERKPIGRSEWLRQGGMLSATC